MDFRKGGDGTCEHRLFFFGSHKNLLGLFVGRVNGSAEAIRLAVNYVYLFVKFNTLRNINALNNFAF